MKSKFKLVILFLLAMCFLGIVSGCNAPENKSYTITFVADGTTVGTATYIEGDTEITVPEVPAKDHYTGAWEMYALNGEDLTVNAVYTAVEYSITFIADGETVDTVKYTIENTAINEPAVPAKDNYTGAWESYALDGGDKTVNAFYTVVEYTITFVADGTRVDTVKYTAENTEIEEPAVPVKEHYTGEWEDYSVDSGDKTVNAVYTAIEYTVTFVADGTPVETVTYTIEDATITEPAVPAKDNYTGVWEAYTLGGGDKIVNAVYTAEGFEITFVADGEIVGKVVYTVEDIEIEEPAVPEKEHYTGAWETYTLDSGDKTVNAVYTAVEYSVAFVSDGRTVSIVKYTVENTSITEPAVPAKAHYSGVWERYTLVGGDKTVNAVYTAVEYAITFRNGDDVVQVVKFSVNDNDKQAPDVPDKKGYTGVWGAYDFSKFENQTCDLNYTANTYKITYDALDGTAGVALQDVVYDAAFTLTTATSSKVYRDFLGWQDEDGNTVSDGIWTTDSDITLFAVYSKGLTFETWSDVNTDYMWADGTAGTAVIATENGNKCLKIPVTGTSPKLKVTLEFLAMYFEDETVQYVAFDAKTDITSSGNFRRYTWDPSKSALSYVTYEFNSDNFGIRPNLWKSFYFTRADYQTWVDNDFVYNEFITAGGFTAGDNLYIDNIRPITAEEYLDDIYGFEGGWLRLNGTSLLYYIPTNSSAWELRVLFYDAANTPAEFGFTNDNASHGKSSIMFNKPAGKYGFGFNGSGTAKNDLRATGYYAFDLYVPADSDAILYETGKDYAVGTPKAGEWTTIYVNSSNASPIYFIDTTGGTYYLDHFRSVSEEEFNAALYSFEAGAGALRDSTATSDKRFYYYAGADYIANRWSIFVRSDGTELGDPHFDDNIVYDGNVSLAFTKTNGGLTMAINPDSEAYALFKDGFTFRIYSTVGLNGISANNFVNGNGEKFNDGDGVSIQADTWTKVTIAVDDMSSNGWFLQIAGSTAGTIYLDDFRPL